MKAALAHCDQVDLDSREARYKLAKLVTNLFDRWGLTQADQLNLLGLSDNSRSILNKMRKGTQALPSSRDVQDRVGYLLAIHKALRLLYPRNEHDRYHWVSQRNADFKNREPLELMREQGLIGVAKVSRYLDHLRGV